MSPRLKLKIDLKSSFSILFGSQILLIFTLVILIFVLYTNQHNLSLSQENYFKSYLLADELRQSSDDLSRLVRAYVATNNPEFELEYYKVLDIRNGKVPRPVYYNRIYWDFYSANQQAPRPDGEKISLRDLMVKQGFTKEELAKLDLAQSRSDQLAKLEITAMNAMKGIFNDKNDKSNSKNKPDQALANKLVNDENYYKTKASIMQPIDEFYVMFQGRNSAIVNRFLNLNNILFWLVMSLAVLVLILFLYSFITVRRQIDKRIQAEIELADLNTSLEKKINDRIKALQKSEIKSAKALKDAQRLNKLMVGRELEMIELKKVINDLKSKKLN